MKTKTTRMDVATALEDETRKPNPDVERIVAAAIKVIGNREEALRWMGTPVRALGFSTPVSLLATPEGEARVLAVLSQLEHGVM
jgi:putative toxin-antitoxin system antitoxin component (TIGR02293 family)